MILRARHLFRRRAFALFMVAACFSPPAGFAQDRPSEFREFLSKYTGKEILLVTMSSDSLQFNDADTTQRFVVVLDEVGIDALIVHRTTDSDKRSLTYPIADIRRITYLFGRRPYKRIVVETF